MSSYLFHVLRGRWGGGQRWGWVEGVASDKNSDIFEVYLSINYSDENQQLPSC